MYIPHARASLVTQKVKNMPAVQETWVQYEVNPDALIQNEKELSFKKQ